MLNYRTHKKEIDAILTKEFLLDQILKKKTNKEMSLEANVCIGLISERLDALGIRKRAKKSILLPGEKYGKLTLVKRVRDNRNRSCWLCRCECGVEKTVMTGNLVRRSPSCGCSRYSKKPSNWTGYEDISGTFLNQIKTNARRRNLKFSITIKQMWELFLKQNKKCKISGLDLTLMGYGVPRSKSNASLDRIDSSKGYTIKNVQWVHKDVNWIKMDYEEDYFIELCRKIAENNPRTT